MYSYTNVKLLKAIKKPQTPTLSYLLDFFLILFINTLADEYQFIKSFVKNAENALSKKLKSDFLPAQIKNQIKSIEKSGKLTFEQFEALRTNLAAEARKADRANDGNASAAIGIVRNALEDMPLTKESQHLKSIADNARALARARFESLSKDPAYKAAISESVPADKYFDKFVINGVNKNLNTMLNNLGKDSLANQHMRAGVINWLSEKANVGSGNFSSSGYNKALKKLDDVRNLQEIFDTESQLKLKTLGNVADYTTFQPRGSFVNNSNTLVSYLGLKPDGAVEKAANVAGLKFMGYPIGTRIRKGVERAREEKQADESLSFGAGSINKK